MRSLRVTLVGPPGTMTFIDLEEEPMPKTNYRFYKLDKGMRVTITKRDNYGVPDIQNVIIDIDTIVIPLFDPVDFKLFN